MKLIISLSSLLSMLIAMGMTAAAFAQQRDAPDEHSHQASGEGVGAHAPRLDEQADAPFMAEPTTSRVPQRRERLSLEERRKLRQDIHEAGRSIYHHGQYGRTANTSNRSTSRHH